MADSDTSFTVMAVRLGKKERTVRKWIERLIDGGSKGVGLDEVAMMAFACGGAILTPKIERREPPTLPTTNGRPE